VQDNGVYRWQVSIAWPSTSASYAVWQYVMVNGTIDTGGSNRTQQASGQGTTYYTSGDICQPGAGGTVQAACQASTAGVTGVIPQAFSLYRVA
ncbi:MAG TPA: hypothetical protein VFH54_06985, partial [Mycobacteriales bacterium]|nr:hypothetical protein [Mycobacteriales bacterium]